MISEHQRKNREQEISELMRFLKSVAIKYKIAVIITSQMNRYVEWRGGSKRPILSDLRESGTIEEIADKVLLVYRPETSGIILDEENNSTIGKAEIIVAKNRLGPTGDVILSFDKNFGLFESISWDKKVFPSLDLPDNPFNERPF
jgi:replicative DNA helicase